MDARIFRPVDNNEVFKCVEDTEGGEVTIDVDGNGSGRSFLFGNLDKTMTYPCHGCCEITVSNHTLFYPKKRTIH